MYVLDNTSGERRIATVTRIDSLEVSKINRTKDFDFNWNKEKGHNVYKLVRVDVDETIGLLSLLDRKDDFAFEIKLLAASKENVGKKQKYSRIAGCLTNHYINKYGLKSTKMYLITEGGNSLKLIKEYYEV